MSDQVYVYTSGDLAAGVQPLTDDELKWATRLHRVLAACPTERLALVTIGDSGLTIIDEEYRSANDLCEADGGAVRLGFALAELAGKPLVHGVSS